MKYTNIHNIEPIFQRAVEREPYSKAGSDFSITELLQPPKIKVLAKSLGEDHTIDISTRIDVSLGHAWHLWILQGARPDIDVTEKRYFAKFGIYTVSAQIDLYENDNERLLDWKVTKSFPFTDKGGKGQKPDWLYQLNGQAEIMRRNGISPKSLHIAGILKDFDKEASKLSSRKYQKGYPKCAITTVRIPMLESSEITAFMEERIKKHLEAREVLPKCSSDETWGSRRCENWCEVNHVCEQYKQAQKTGLMEG